MPQPLTVTAFSSISGYFVLEFSCFRRFFDRNREPRIYAICKVHRVLYECYHRTTSALLRQLFQIF